MAPVGDRGLLPLLPDRVVAEDAVADESIGLLVEFVHGAAGGDRVHVGAGDGRAILRVRIEGVPITQPEIQLMVFRSRAVGGSGCGATGGSGGGQQGEGEQRSQHGGISWVEVPE